MAILVSAAVDLSLSAANGYQFIRPMRRLPLLIYDLVLVASLEIFFVSLVVVPVFLLLGVARRLPGPGTLLERAPWFSILAAAYAPIALCRLFRGHGTTEVVAGVAAAAALCLLLVVEARVKVPGHRNSATEATVGGVAIVVIVLVLVLPGWSRHMPPEAPPGVAGEKATAEAPNLLVIVLDTVRADHLATYGYPRPTSPWLAQFAAQALVFDYAIAPTSSTLPTHATLFTGLYPRVHGAMVQAGGRVPEDLGLVDEKSRAQPLAPEAVTLAEVARAAGLETGAVCANFAYLAPFFGLDQGFDSYLVPRRSWYSWQPAGLALGGKIFIKLMPAEWAWWYRSRILGTGRLYLMAPEVNRLASKWLENRLDRRFFLFLNYMDAHTPYMPVGRYRRMFPASDYPQPRGFAQVQTGERDILPHEQAALIDAYDAELRYLDDHLSELFAKIESWGLLDRTLVVIVGDHGESFGEHNLMTHASGLHQSQLHVPLIIRRPGQQAGQRFEHFVHLVDVMTTVVDEMGFETPAGLDLQGGSLFDPQRQVPITAHLSRREQGSTETAIYREPWKLLVSSSGETELYDVRRDPKELDELASDHPDLVRSMLDELRRFEETVRPRFEESTEPMDEDTLRRLQALGYAQ